MWNCICNGNVLYLDTCLTYQDKAYKKMILVETFMPFYRMQERSNIVWYSDACDIVGTLAEENQAKWNALFSKLVERYSKQLQNTHEIERETFLARLYEMARREVQSYGEEYHRKKDYRAGYEVCCVVDM